MHGMPTEPSGRIAALDALRGFAVFGILLSIVNDFGWSLPFADRFFTDSGPLDRAWVLIHETFIGQRFIAIFSLLYGIGLGMQLRKSQATSEGVGFFLRRMGVLALLGIVNTTFFWWGEILLVYALFGLVVICLARIHRVGLLSIAMIVYFILPPLWESAVAPALRAAVEPSFYDRYSYDEMLRIYRSGTFLEMARARWAEYQMLFLHNHQWMRTSLALILVGFCIGRENWHERFVTHVNRYWPMAAVAAVVFALGTLISLVTGVQFVDPSSGFLPFFMFSLWLLACVATYIFAVVWLHEATKALWPRVRPLGWLSNVGRLALTNYILAAVVFSCIYQNNGLGLYGTLPLWTQVPIVLTLFATQVCFSALWLRRYRYGPLEWLWRRLSYANGRLGNAVERKWG